MNIDEVQIAAESPRVRSKLSREHVKRRNSDILLYTLFIVLALVTYGWHYGWHNHAALIPAIYHLMDPSYLANDLEAGDFPIYIRALTWLIAQMAKVIPLPLVCFAFQVFSLLLLFFAVRKLAEALLPKEPLFGWFVVFVLIIYRYFVPGQNLIIGSWILFEPTFYMYTLGYAVTLLALVYLAQNKVVLAGVLAGLALYVQLNHGEQVFLLLGGVLLLSQGRISQKAKNIALFTLIGVTIGAPVLVPAFNDQILSLVHLRSANMDGASFYDVFRFRHRHHLQPTAWPMTHHVMFLMQILATWYLFRVRKRVAWENIDRVCSQAFVVIVLLCGLGYANEWLKIEFIDKSYLFRTSVISAIITVAYSCWALWYFAISKIKEATLQRLYRYGLTALSVYVAAAFLLVYFHPELFTGWRSKIYPGFTFNIELTPLEKHILEHTPKDAVFLVSPDYTNFSVNTKRAGVVNWMAIPFNKDTFREWYRRIVDLTGGRVTIESMRSIFDSYAIRDSVGVAYYRLPPEKIPEIARKYNAQYCVFSANLPFPSEYQWKDLILYKLQ